MDKKLCFYLNTKIFFELFNWLIKLFSSTAFISIFYPNNYFHKHLFNYLHYQHPYKFFHRKARNYYDRPQN